MYDNILRTKNINHNIWGEVDFMNDNFASGKNIIFDLIDSTNFI